VTASPSPPVADGIHRLAIPTPFAVGRVNVYLLEGEPLTLVDSGPNSAKAFDELERGLEALGHAVADLELLVITHQHIDHLGLTGLLARRSGAEVAALDRLAPYVGAYAEQAEADDAFSVALMRRHGLEEQVIQALRAVSAAFRGWGGAAEVTRPLPDNGVLRMGGRDYRVSHRPGHSPSDTVFRDEERGVLIGADHLLGHISSNPLIARPLPGSPEEGKRGRPRALLTYMDSLARTREDELSIVLPGHGDPVTDHRALIDQRFAMHRRRAAKIRGLLDDRPLTAHEIARELWGDVAITQAYLTLSEVLGHADLLVAAGEARELDEGGIVRFAAA
jgi:glyoxylase-like metal-dependent hydrolase (beta-lactamase superfamily II)